MGRKSYSARDLLKPKAVEPPAPLASPAMPATEWLTKEEMIGRLRMGKRFFGNLVKAGKIPHRKYSRKLVRFNPVAVEAALKHYDVEVLE